MTTARSYSGSELVRTFSELIRRFVAGKLLWAVLVALLVSTPVLAQDRPVHWRHAGAMPPGAIGRQRLMRGGPLSGFCQPVEIRAPGGARIAPAAGSGFLEGRPERLLVGLAIGPVYRFRVTEIPGQPGLELFPTVEVVDRLHPPPGEMLRFPIPIELTREELLSAAEGRFITRVIYLEDPTLAIPLDEQDEQRWVEARPGEDPLVVADHLGRPMAILRMGGRVPDVDESVPAFLYGAPPVQIYDRPQNRSMMKKPAVR
ncbi:MAG: hypothetical protein IH898_11510 [Planctomycetes bacterium]|nr:hypothetical protein [Planctomycetota bacterium]